MSTNEQPPSEFAAAHGCISAVEIHDRPSQQSAFGAGGVPRRTEFSACRKYRYTLWREFESTSLWPLARGNQYLMVIGLNPSTADETKDDPTIRKCVGFAKRWGFGALCMTNLFAWRDTDPARMKAAKYPVGINNVNDEWLRQLSDCAGLVLAAWGKHGSHLDRANWVCSKVIKASLRALKLNQDGSPMHPLYVPYETVPCELRGMRVELPKGEAVASEGRKYNESR